MYVGRGAQGAEFRNWPALYHLTGVGSTSNVRGACALNVCTFSYACQYDKLHLMFGVTFNIFMRSKFIRVGIKLVGLMERWADKSTEF